MTDKKKLPLWVKIVVCIAAMGIFVIAVPIAIMISNYKSVHDPDKVKEVADSFMTIADPLPDGFTYKQAHILAEQPFLQIIDAKTPTQFTFTGRREKANGEPNSPEIIMKKALNGDAPDRFGGTGSTKIKVTDKGTIKVGGQDMPYVMGHVDYLVDPNKSEVNAFVGTLRTASKGKILVLWVDRSSGIELTTLPLKLEEVKKLTDTISKF